jgi:peptidoglycan glycosyltransferase
VSKQIRNLGIFLVVIYAALFLQVNRITVFEAEELQENPNNNREVERDFAAPRGSITTADGELIANSVPSEDEYELQRQYPQGQLYAHITGYYGLSTGTAGLEEEYHDELAGRTIDFDLQDIGDVFVDRERVGNLTLSVQHRAQQAAAEALEGRAGSVVALDPRSGAILAMYSNPTYDPNALSSHDFSATLEADRELIAADGDPKRSRAYRERFFPGSTFKVVTGAAGVERGGVTPDNPSYEQAQSYTATEGGRPLRNFDNNTCGGTLFVILQNSCNSAFAEMGVEQVRGDGMIETAEAFGFNDEMPIDLPDAAESVFPTSVTNQETGEETRLDQNAGVLAQLSIGQNGVSATPLQMAMVAAGVANGGTMMEPYVVQEVRDDQDEVIDDAEPTPWREAVSASTADTMRDAMVSVVADGSAVRLDDGLEDYVVGGKTGTAQLGTDPPRSHAWVVGFAGREGEAPQVAVAVIVEGQPGASEQTGGEVAAPIGAQVLQAILEPGPAGGEGAGE